jgi:hypothetical protein
MKKILAYQEYDPMEIPGCTFWLPHDKFREILPTGQRLLYWTCDLANWEYKTLKEKRCLDHTPESSGSYTYSWLDSYRPQTAGVKNGNGCTISMWYYSRKSSLSNALQVIFSSTPCVGDDETFDPTTGATQKQIISPIGNYYGAINETQTGETTITALTGKAVSQLRSENWNIIQWTISPDGAITLYANGTQRGTGQITRSGWIGAGIRAYPNRACTGRYRCCRIYDRVLTTEELAKLRTE